MAGLAVVLAVVVALSLGAWIVRRRRTPAELRGDWWGRFESEFWTYARGLDQPHGPQPRGPRQRGDERRSIGQ